MERLSFKERLASLVVVDWSMAQPTGPQGPSLVLPLVVSVESRPIGVLDGVSAAIFLQGIESNRLLVALNDTLCDVAQALQRGDLVAVKVFLEQELDLILCATGDHLAASCNAIDSAISAHEAATVPTDPERH